MQTYTRSDGVRLRYLDDGQGMAVLLMPGSAGTHDVYDGQVRPLLDAGYRVVRLDREGRGRSDWGRLRFSGVEEARDAWAILDALGIERAVLAGRSSGAGVIREMYLTRPERVIALVCIDSDSFGKFRPLLPPGAPANLRAEDDIDGGLDPRFDADMTAAYHRNKATLQPIENALWDHPSDFNTRARVEWAAQLEQLKAALASRPENPADADTAVPPDGERWWCRVPLLVFAAGRGRVGPDDPEARELKARLPSPTAVLVVARNSGHWVNVEAKTLFDRALLEFLGTLREGVNGAAADL